MTILPVGMLRRWQEEALNNYFHTLHTPQRQSLWEATPGAGKTTAALHLCLHQLQKRDAKMVIIVVPTRHLKTQWAQSAARVHIQLDSDFNHLWGLASDYHGIVVTYQQIANNPSMYRKLSRNAVVVLDEVHHAGDGLTWGDSLQLAFEPANYVLCLSGTAFRSDNAAIPFVRYEEGESMPDYVYGYGQAIEDGVCRPLAFITYGGHVAWQEGDAVLEARFVDDLNGSTNARRLRAALDPRSGWITPMLIDAHQMLQEVRLEHPNAGGLLVAVDQDHARQLADLLAQVSKSKPAIALSDDSQASNKIKQFANGNAPWLVACNMVSEGVDIPRLRVGVYATTVTTKMYFRQFLGRMVRVTPQPKATQVAYCYLPADVRLKGLAAQVEHELRHRIHNRGKPEMERLPQDKLREPTPNWQALQSHNSGVEAVIMNGRQLSLFSDPALVPEVSHVRQEVQKQVAPLTKKEQKAELAEEIKELVAVYRQQTGQTYQTIHTQLNRQQFVASQSICTEKQLRERVALLKKWIRR